MDYEQYLQDRMSGMYSLLESSEIVMEATKKKGKKAAFMKFMEGKGKKAELEKDIKNAKSKEQKISVAKKYSKDFAEWAKKERINIEKTAGMIASVALVGQLGLSTPATAFIAIIGWETIFRAFKLDEEK